MLKTFFRITGGLAIIGIGVVIYVLRTPPEKIQTAKRESAVLTTTLEEILTKEKEYACSLDDATRKTTGILYVSGKKVRGDLQTELEYKRKVETHFILNGEWYYLWSTGNTPFKLNVGEQAATGSASPIANYGTNKLRCLSWRNDGKTFEPPEGVTFIDLTEQLRKLDVRATESASPKPGNQ